MTIPPTPTPSSTSGCVVIFNQGQPGRTDLFGGTPGGIGVTIPVVSASFATGEELCTLTTLEVARQITKFNTANRIPFAFWGAEELGLVGSTRYVASLGNAQKGAIALNLNFDMVGSPKFVRFVYDGDNSAFPPGSGVQPGRLRRDREGVHPLLRQPEPAVGADAVQRSLRLRPVHHRHPSGKGPDAAGRRRRARLLVFVRSGGQTGP